MGAHTAARVAVVGSGVSGLTAAWILAAAGREVTLYEAAPRLGGHADTHQVTAPDGTVLGVDTGFIVHNTRTYRRAAGGPGPARRPGPGPADVPGVAVTRRRRVHRRVHRAGHAHAAGR
jgi:flavin-dependent dehydrogenase